MNQDKLTPKIGIITALEEEYVAVKSQLENGKSLPIQKGRIAREYWLGEITAFRGGKHQVVLTLARMGTNMAATRAERLISDFPNIESIIMSGIAGGCPNPDKADENVRLGDIIVSGEKGIIQYDFDKETLTGKEIRNPPRPPSSFLIDAVRLIKAAEHEKEFLWKNFINEGLKKLNWKRPSPTTDQIINHPRDGKRQRGIPRVFVAPIACANKLLKNPALRDSLRDTFGVRAVEMESSGIADATWDNAIGYLAVRGVCDYCDSNKNDIWHNYAAMVAAAYTKALIASLPAHINTMDEIQGISPSSTDSVKKGQETLKLSHNFSNLKNPVIQKKLNPEEDDTFYSPDGAKEITARIAELDKSTKIQSQSEKSIQFTEEDFN